MRKLSLTALAMALAFAVSPMATFSAEAATVAKKPVAHQTCKMDKHHHCIVLKKVTKKKP